MAHWIKWVGVKAMICGNPSFMWLSTENKTKGTYRSLSEASLWYWDFKAPIV